MNIKFKYFPIWKKNKENKKKQLSTWANIDNNRP